MNSYSKLKTILEEKRSFVLVCHVDPDGDAVGSLAAFAEVLESRGKKVYRICKDPVPEIFNFLTGANLIENKWPRDFDAVILLDNGDFRRTGFTEEILSAKKRNIPVINIDHHPKNDLWRVAKINCADDSVSSTCEILYGILTRLGYEINNSIATSLLTGIFYDTGSFQHANTTEKVLEITSELLKKGAKLKIISQKLVNARSMALFKLWGIALGRLNVNEKYEISYSILTQKDLEKTNATEEEIFGLVNLLSTNASSKVALLLYETGDGKIKGSLRTENDCLNLSKFAAFLNGGGHKKAAGFTISGEMKNDGAIWKIT
ncbi:MAG: bifunctional oligoribonuclease/PAP phosphatase NrnA [bacterium]|nr:bifunctional oligoribonuclease/PAP phosphatase NrnA [bacterium]